MAYRGQRDYSILPRSPSEALEPERAPEPPRGSRQRRQNPLVVFASWFITFLLIGSVAVIAIFQLTRREFDQPGPLGYPTVFVVPKNEGVRTIARRLQDEGIINDTWTFIVAARKFDLQKKIKAGEYNIKAGASIRDVLDVLVEGKSIMYRITIPEGFTSYQIVERLKANPDLNGDLTEIPAEGSLLPDTYPFARNTTRDGLVRRMQGEQKKFLDGLWASRAGDLPLTRPEDVLNLAAIVEREASQADERRHVAAVYLNRLKKGMLLQADPTIIYGASNGQGSLGRPILRSELENRDNPYNTYKHKGLPPTPIANPGRAAIEAVLNPDKSKDLYFVADGSGGHVFAENLADHQRNVAKWRRIEKEREEVEPGNGASGLSGSALDKLQTQEIPLPQRNPHR
jgi:UPF0755 protein